jgi:hypothetical protein
VGTLLAPPYPIAIAIAIDITIAIAIAIAIGIAVAIAIPIAIVIGHLFSSIASVLHACPSCQSLTNVARSLTGAPQPRRIA